MSDPVLAAAVQVLAASQAAQFQHERERLYESLADGLFLIQDGRLVYVNQAGLRLVGADSVQQVLGTGTEQLTPPEWTEFHRTHIDKLHAGQALPPYEMQCRRLDGSVYTGEVSASMTLYRGRPALQSLVRDVSARRLERALLEHERTALEQIARDAPLEQVLDELCRAVEKQLPGARCSVVLVDEAGKRLSTAAAPSLPAEYCQALQDVAVGPAEGSCGTAIRRGEPVIVRDIETDPLWERYRALARAHGLRSCWSLPIFRADGRVAGTFGVYHPQVHAPDENELRLLQTTARLAQVAVQQSRLSATLSWLETERDLLVSTVASGILTLAADGVIASANPAAYRMLDRPAGALQGARIRDVLADAVTESGEPLPGTAAGGIRLQPVRDYVLGMPGRRGEQRWYSVTVCELPAGSAAAQGVAFVCSFSDVTQLKLAQQQLVALATRDPLTKLPNRAALAQAAQGAIQAAGRSGRTLAMLVMDLDGFKHVNDTFGHAAGDALLRDVAARLTSAMRPSDILARRSGDEFVILACDADEAGTARLAGRLLESLRTPFFLAEREVFVGASIGAAVFPGHGSSEAELFGRADAAMYRAKRAGRNRFMMHEPAAASDGRDRITRETELRYAIARQELELHYQPRVDSASGRITGAEALVRWRHPERGLVPPMDFIPLAEETGLIVPLGDWVLRQACRQAADWTRQGLPDLQVSVNVSTRQFSEAFFARTVPAALADSGLPASRLEMEVTESAMMGQADAATLSALQALRDRGVRVLLDDFGTGYSSLSYLHKFPLDGIKIDRGFVARLHETDQSRAVTQAIVAMASALNLRTVAEGVETAWQCDWLVKAGSSELQGYLFSRPLPNAELIDRLRREAGRADGEPAHGPPREAARHRPAARPADEPARLQALRAANLLDTLPEPTLDAVAEFVARTLEMPVALVSLVDEHRQWFKSKVGISASETPREWAFCAHAIHSDEPFVIEDATADDRFADNLLVAGPPRVRFYAGVPVTARDALGLQRRIGTLCVVDWQPRRLRPDQLELLAGAARIVSRHIDRAA